jgi:hypothetical protein
MLHSFAPDLHVQWRRLMRCRALATLHITARFCWLWLQVTVIVYVLVCLCVVLQGLACQQ